MMRESLDGEIPPSDDDDRPGDPACWLRHVDERAA
jgi:hypothetical protein